jgi:uncharacterized membrane protein
MGIFQMRFLLNRSYADVGAASEIQSMTKTRMSLFRNPEGHGRSLMKAVSWRMVGTIDTFVISFFVTGKASLAGGIAAVEVVTKIMIYYLHERVWAVVPWGRR